MRYFLLILGVTALIGCSSRVPLTKGLIKDYGLSVRDMTRLQLYISGGILLEKRMTVIDKNIDASDYSLKKVEDYYVKQVFFAKGTPCVATSAAADKLSVAFEEPGDALNFASGSHGDTAVYAYVPDKKAVRDTVKARPAEAGFRNWKTIGEENYSDTLFTVLVKSSLPYLIVDKTSLKNFIMEMRRVKGLKQTEILR